MSFKSFHEILTMLYASHSWRGLEPSFDTKLASCFYNYQKVVALIKSIMLVAFDHKTLH